MSLDNLYQVLNLVEQFRNMQNTTDITMIGFVILLAFGALNCILGYRLLRFWMMIFGFLIGAVAGYGISRSIGVYDQMIMLGIAAGAGAVLAIIVFFSYKAGIFLLGAGLGFGLGIYILHPTSSLTFFLCILIGIGVGVLATKRAREILIIGTSLFGGALAGFALVKLTYLDEIPYGLVFGAAFALMGMLIQFATNRIRVEDDEEEEEIAPEEYEDSDYVDPHEYLPSRRTRAEKEEDRALRRLEREEMREKMAERKRRRKHTTADERVHSADPYKDQITYDLKDLDEYEDSEEFETSVRYRDYETTDLFTDPEDPLDQEAPDVEHTVRYQVKRHKPADLDVPLEEVEDGVYVGQRKRQD